MSMIENKYNLYLLLINKIVKYFKQYNLIKTASLNFQIR